ncbi:MAG: hypothetical protein Q7Q73_00475 [Verrucomicrobiota bacterium JB024]|nr:hypothetical protein [Verrucomicrobiota bacterium JB024]
MFVVLNVHLMVFGDNANLPYATDFEQEEGYQLGLVESGEGWYLESGLEGEILSGGASGAQSLSLGGGQWITFDANSSAPLTVTWVDLFMKPVFVEVGELPEVISTEQSAVTGFVKIDTQGEVYAVNGDGLGGGAWVPSGQRTALTDNIAQDWIRLTYRIDYATKTWDLFVDGQMALADLGFLDNTLNAFSQFAIRSDAEDPTAFDFFYAGEGNPLFVDTSNDGLPDAWAVSQGLNPSANNRYGDDDMDGLDNLAEYMLSTRTDNADTDGDGVSDGMEYALGEDPLTADNYALNVLPFADGFETYDVGLPPLLNGWAVAGDTVEVQQGDVFSGQAALSVGEGATVSNHYNGSGNAVVWVDVYLKPTPSHETPEVPEDASVVYYFNKEGQPVAFDGLGSGSGFWTLLDAATSADWRRVTVKANYQAQSYDIYVDGERLGVGLGFAHTQPFLSRFEVRESTMVDDVSVTTTEPAGLDDDRDGLDNATEASLGTSSVAFDSDQDGLADSLEALWGLDPMVADTSVAIPTEIEPGVFYWATAFSGSEGYVNGALGGQHDWAASGTVNVSEEEDVSLEQASMDEQSFERLFGVGENRRIWITFRAKLLVGPMPDVSELSEPAVALMGFTDRDTMVVWDEASQTWDDFATVADPTEWNDYAIYLDYVNQQWSICQNGVLLASGLPFKDKNLTVFSRFKALQARLDEETDPQHDPLQASFDDVTISNAEPTGLDYDGDGLDNDLERQLGSDILLADTDGDGLDDAWEYQYGFNLLVRNANTDADGDGLKLLVEYEYGTNPSDSDTDHDGLNDTMEIAFLRDPNSNEDAVLVESADPWVVKNISNSIGLSVRVYDAIWMASNGTGFTTHGSDNVSFAYQQIAGDFEYSTKVEFPVGAPNTWMAGIMVREDVDARSAMAGILITPNGTVYQQDRAYYKGKVGRVGDSIIKSAVPGWLKIKRQGDEISVWLSSDGQHWDKFYNTTLELSDSLLCGMVVTSGDAETIAGVAFSDHNFDYDADSDGILASEEILAGTSDSTADSDGDQISDLREQTEFYTDPTQNDLDAPIVVTSVRGRSLTVASGSWVGYGNGRYCDSICGELAWQTDLSESGVYQLTVSAGFAANDTYDPVFSIDVEVDGEFIKTLKFDIDDDFAHDGAVLLPWLASGEHDIRLVVKNTYLFRKIWVNDVKLEAIGGEDADNDGIADWVNRLLLRNNGVDSTTIESRTSPLCLTGISRYPGFTEVDGNVVVPGPNYKWLNECTLNENGETVFTISFENEALTSEVSASWMPTNVFNEASDIYVRKGDSLKLMALPDGKDANQTAQIHIGGELVYEGLASGYGVYEFNEAGEYTVNGIYSPASGSQTASVKVIVVDAAFAPSPLAVVDQSRKWKSSDLPAESVVESDARMIFENASASDFNIRTDASRDRYVWARLGEDGPVLDRQVIRGTQVATLANTGLFAEQTYEDGVVCVLMPVVVDNLEDDFRLTLDIFIGGVLFEDGTTFMELSPSDFDETGVAFVRFLKSPGKSATCHTARAYQDNFYIGKNK